MTVLTQYAPNSPSHPSHLYARGSVLGTLPDGPYCNRQLVADDKAILERIPSAACKSHFWPFLVALLQLPLLNLCAYQTP